MGREEQIKYTHRHVPRLQGCNPIRMLLLLFWVILYQGESFTKKRERKALGRWVLWTQAGRKRGRRSPLSKAAWPGEAILDGVIISTDWAHRVLRSQVWGLPCHHVTKLSSAKLYSPGTCHITAQKGETSDNPGRHETTQSGLYFQMWWSALNKSLTSHASALARKEKKSPKDSFKNHKNKKQGGQWPLSFKRIRGAKLPKS